MGRSTDPHVSAPQWTSPDAKSAVSIPATGMGCQEESHMEKKIWDQKMDNASPIQMKPYVAADTIARVSSSQPNVSDFSRQPRPYNQFCSIIDQHRREHTLAW